MRESRIIGILRNIGRILTEGRGGKQVFYGENVV
jgi:hypothetical protein